jgi:hypothetical protein
MYTLTINWRMYVCVCMCVYVCVCMCVCVSGHAFQHVSMYILQTWWQNYMGRCTLRGLYLCVCTQRARVHAKRTHMCLSLFLEGLCPNLLGTYYDSPEGAWATYVSCSYNTRMRASARVVKHSLIFGRILFKFAGTYFKSPPVANHQHVFHVHTPRTRAHVVKRSLYKSRPEQSRV